jgi:hypothetical protein
MLIAFSVTALVIGLIFISPASAGDLQISAGTEYEYISSDFFLLTEDTLSVSPDSLDALKRSIDAANELSVFGKIQYGHKFSDLVNLEIYNRTSGSSESFKSNLDVRLYAGIFKLINYFNLRNLDREGEESLNNDYITNTTYAIARPHLGRDFYFRIRNSFEFTRYDNPSGYFYNYNYNKLNFMIEKDFGFDGRVGAGYRNDIKKVSDSTRLEYNRHVFLFEADYSPSWRFSAYLYNEFYIKDSEKEDNIEDGSLNNFELTLNYNPSFDFRIKFLGQFEYSSYDVQDFVYFNQYYSKNKLEFRYSVGEKLAFSIAPEYRRLAAQEPEFNSQDFYEYLIEPRVEYILGTNLWLDISFEIGRHIYSGESSEIFSDHNLYQFNLLFDATIANHIAVYVLASVDWERHELEYDNTNLYLITSSFEYRF